MLGYSFVSFAARVKKRFSAPTKVKVKTCWCHSIPQSSNSRCSTTQQWGNCQKSEGNKCFYDGLPLASQYQVSPSWYWNEWEAVAACRAGNQSEAYRMLWKAVGGNAKHRRRVPNELKHTQTLARCGQISGRVTALLFIKRTDGLRRRDFPFLVFKLVKWNNIA